MRVRMTVVALLLVLCGATTGAVAQVRGGPDSRSAPTVAEIFREWKRTDLGFSVAFPNFGTVGCTVESVGTEVVTLRCSPGGDMQFSEITLFYGSIVAIFGPLNPATGAQRHLVLMASSARPG